jgi:hypothetical protein
MSAGAAGEHVSWLPWKCKQCPFKGDLPPGVPIPCPVCNGGMICVAAPVEETASDGIDALVGNEKKASGGPSIPKPQKKLCDGDSSSDIAITPTPMTEVRAPASITSKTTLEEGSNQGDDDQSGSAPPSSSKTTLEEGGNQGDDDQSGSATQSSSDRHSSDQSQKKKCDGSNSPDLSISLPAPAAESGSPLALKVGGDHSPMQYISENAPKKPEGSHGSDQVSAGLKGPLRPDGSNDESARHPEGSSACETPVRGNQASKNNSGSPSNLDAPSHPERSNGQPTVQNPPAEGNRSQIDRHNDTRRGGIKLESRGDEDDRFTEAKRKKSKEKSKDKVQHTI